MLDNKTFMAMIALEQINKPSSRPVACLLSGAHPSLGRADVSYVLYALYSKNWYPFYAGLSARLGGVYGFHRRHTGNLDLVSNMVDHLVGMAGKRNRRPIGFGEGILPAGALQAAFNRRHAGLLAAHLAGILRLQPNGRDQ
jgi:hypothetical protein